MPSRPRSLAPALLAGHAVLLAVLAVVSLLALAVGVEPGVEQPGAGRRAAAVAVGVVVVGLAAHRVGTRPQSRTGRWLAVLGLVSVAAWVWGTTWVAPLEPSTAPLLLVLPLYVWPVALGALVAGVVVATADLAVGALLSRRR